MYAVVETGGKQYRVRAGDLIRVEKLALEVGASLSLERVLMIGDGDGATYGTPYVLGGKVDAMVKAQGRADKINVIKFKRRKGYHRRQGHRQSYTELQITTIAPPGSGGEE
jgi:large subunit ribosomal protein L21